MALSSAQVAAFRLRRHYLTGNGEPDLTMITQSVCGIQAQVMGPARKGLWARNHDITLAEIDTALWENHSLVKTSLMRGTLHLVRSEDFSIYITVLCLLPHFDCYLLGHALKDHLVDEAHYKRVYRKAAWISPVILLNGRIIGVWSQRLQRRQLIVEVDLFTTISREAREGIEQEAAGLAGFLEASECEVRYE